MGSYSNMSRGPGSSGYKGYIGDENYRILQRSVKNIKRNLVVEHILDDLISKEVLSIEDGMEIRTHKVDHKMADVLIQKLRYVGEEGFQVFLNVLRSAGYGYVIEFESPGATQRFPTESSDPITAQHTSHLSESLKHSHSCHNHPHHVQFTEPVQQQFNTPTQLSVSSTQKPHGHSILIKPTNLPLEKRHDLPLATTMNVADTPSSGNDDDNYDDIDDDIVDVGDGNYHDCKVGPKTDNIILKEPIPYKGNPALFGSWYPVKNMDHRLREYPGCHPDVDERNIKRIIRENETRDRDYVIWYSHKRELLIVTTMYKSSPKGRYHYKVKRRKSGNQVKYRFSSQMETPSVIELLEYVKAEGLPPPVQKSQSDQGISSN